MALPQGQGILTYIACIEGPCNLLGDILSRLQHLVTPAQITEGQNLVELTVDSDNFDDMCFLTQECFGFPDNDLMGMIEFYLSPLEIPHPYCNSLNYAHMWELQQHEKKLLDLHNKYPDNYIKLKLDDDVDSIICYKKDPAQDNWKFTLHEEMVLDTLKCFHQVMRHHGQDRLHEM